MMQKVSYKFLVLAFVFIACTGSSASEVRLLTGRTMGTTYHIKVVSNLPGAMAQLQERIDQRLVQINRSMSTFLDDSEISRFNQWRDTDKPFTVSEDFLKVMLVADGLYQVTRGAWDGTVNPLINLWGFGRSGVVDKVPASSAIADALQNVGFRYIEVSPKGFLRKRRADVTLDLASIAKGYGVDAVAQLVKSMGYKHYLVEIGGEVVASGTRHDGNPWRVGINVPQKGAAATAVYKAMDLEDRAMATSGDYRNYIEIDGRTYSHVIDPRTGYPVDNGVVSATVVAPDCTLADGMATALMVMGVSEGIALLNTMEKVDGLIVVRSKDGDLVNHWSRGFEVGRSTDLDASNPAERKSQ